MSRRESWSVEDRLTHAQSDIESLEGKLRDLLIEKKALEVQVAKEATVKNGLASELAAVTADFDALASASKEIEDQLENDLRAAKEQTSAVQGLLEQATRQYKSAQQQVAELQLQLTNVTGKKEAAERRVLQLEVECEALESKVRRYESTYEKLVEKHNEVLQQLAMQSAELDQCREELREAAEAARRARVAADERPAPAEPRRQEKTDNAPSTIAYLCLAAVVAYIGYSTLFKQRGSE